jgi:hypothetical protein
MPNFDRSALPNLQRDTGTLQLGLFSKCMGAHYLTLTAGPNQLQKTKLYREDIFTKIY